MPDVLSVPCLYCGAKEHERCINQKTKQLLGHDVHPCRRHAVDPVTERAEEWWQK